MFLIRKIFHFENIGNPNLKKWKSFSLKKRNLNLKKNLLIRKNGNCFFFNIKNE